SCGAGRVVHTRPRASGYDTDRARPVDRHLARRLRSTVCRGRPPCRLQVHAGEAGGPEHAPFALRVRSPRGIDLSRTRWRGARVAGTPPIFLGCASLKPVAMSMTFARPVRCSDAETVE